MHNIIKLTIYENDKIIKAIETETSLEHHYLIKSLEDFRRTVNDTLTKIIEDDGSFEDYIEEFTGSEGEDESTEENPKKRKL